MEGRVGTTPTAGWVPAVGVVGAALDGVKVADEEVVFGVRILKWVRRKGHWFWGERRVESTCWGRSRVESTCGGEVGIKRREIHVKLLMFRRSRARRGRVVVRRYRR